MDAANIVGRDAELAAIEEFLDEPVGKERVLLLEGEAGIGKTAVWQAGLEFVRQRSSQVFVCRSVEAEAKLAYSALGDLLEHVQVDAVDALPVPQARALASALLRIETVADIDRRAVGVGLRSLLALFAETSDVVVAVDDAHWLDSSSLMALEFAFRRLRGESIRLIATRRPVENRKRDPLGTLEGVRVVRLGPLSLGAVHELLKERLGRSLPRPQLARVHAVSGGNPFYALELARRFIEHGPTTALPSDLSQLTVDQLRRVGREGREILCIAAASAHPTVRLLEAVWGEGARDVVDRLEEAGLVQLRDGVVRFAHPLYAATIYAEASAPVRRRVHRRLADAIRNSEERARHLALSADAPDSATAEALSRAAAAARRRGATSEGAELAQLALEATPDHDDKRNERRLELAEHLFRLGETVRPQALLDDLCAEVPAGRLRARALVASAAVAFEADTRDVARMRCLEALPETQGDTALEARVRATLALVTEEGTSSNAEAREALRLLGTLDDPDPRVEGLALLAFVESEFYLGRGIPEEAAQRALELERFAPSERVADRFSPALGVYLKYSDRLDEARGLFMEARQAAIDEQDESSLAYVVSHLPQLELWAGNWDLAETYAREHLALAEQLEQSNQRLQALYNMACVETHRGRIESAKASIVEGRGLTATLDSAWLETIFWDAEGTLLWSMRDAEGAIRAFERAAAGRAGINLADPGYGRSEADHAEALVAAGRLDEAHRIVERRAEAAAALDRPAALAVAERCRALLAAAEGDLARAQSHTLEALAQHARVPLPFEVARTQLVKGQVERRAKRRSAAAATLRDALDGFRALGAPLWAAHTERELGRVGIRTSATNGLTPSERRVAELAASGLTNRAVAAQLFMSPKTVEANLARVYRKLGIRSRAELGARLATGRPAPPE